MKTRNRVWSISAILAAGVFVAAFASEKIKVTSDGIKFKVFSSTDDSDEPYEITFKQDGVNSVYKFTVDDDDPTDIRVEDIEVDSEVYKVKYRRSGRLKKVKLVSSERRGLQGEDEGDEQDVQLPVASSVATYACDDCEEHWDIVCGSGLDTLCNLVDHGDPFSDEASASVSAICTSFGSACGSVDASTACDGQCTLACVRALQISLEWFDTGDLDLHVIEPTGNKVYYGNDIGDVGFQDHDNTWGPTQDPENYLMYSGLDVDVDTVLGEYQAYATVYIIRGDSIPWKMTATVNGEVVWIEEGEFINDASRRLSTGSGSSSTTTEPISDVFTVNLEEYVDNGCENTAFESGIVAADEQSGEVAKEKEK